MPKQRTIILLWMLWVCASGTRQTQSPWTGKNQSLLGIDVGIINILNIPAGQIQHFVYGLTGFLFRGFWATVDHFKSCFPSGLKEETCFGNTTECYLNITTQ